jgi:hypothetical protein
LGGAQGQIVLTWQLVPGPPIPVVLKPPQNQVVELGQSALFEVEAENAATIVWLLNGQPLPNALGPTLLIPAVTLEDVGLYVARLFGFDGQSFVDSAPAWIEIGATPGAISYDKFESLFDPLGSGGRGGAGPPTGIPVTAGTVTSQVLNNHNSTTQAGEPNHCGRLSGSTRWFGPVFTMTNGLTFEVDTIGSAIDTILAAYVGQDLLTITNVDCAVGPGSASTIRFPAVAGQPYSLAVDGTNGVQGQIVLNYRLGAEPVWLQAPADQLAMPGEPVALVAAASGVPAPAYQWHTNGVPIPGATAATLEIASAEPGHAALYSVTASNYMGVGVARAQLVVGTPFDFGFQLIQTNGQPALLVVGPTNALATQPYVVEASFDFVAWDRIWTNTMPEVRTNFVDIDHVFYDYRFYRAVPLQP